MAKYRPWIMVGVAIISLIGLWMALVFQPTWLVARLAPVICPNAVYGINTTQPVVALTIDDGPDINNAPEQSTTTAMLSVLERHQARATFFLISNKLTTATGTILAQNIVAQGQEIGNHFTTDVRSIRVSDAEFARGLQTADRVLSAFALPRWFRPAGGFCSTRNAEAIQAQDYNAVLGNIWPYDTHIPFTGFATWQILAAVRPGAIIILHDSDKAGLDHPRDGQTTRGQRTVQILETVLPILQAKGYQVVTLSELMTYGVPVRNAVTLPSGVDILRRRLVSGMLLPSLVKLPTGKSWVAIALIGLTTSGLMLWLGWVQQFLRWQWLSPPLNQSYARTYAQVILVSFLVPALVEEGIFRLILLPSPEEIMGNLTRGQWGECVMSLGLFVVAHPLINGPWRDRIGRGSQGHREEQEIRGEHPTRATAYSQTFRQPIFLCLATILGIACTAMYLQSGSIWPSVCFHWLVVAMWLLALGGDRHLHPPY